MHTHEESANEGRRQSTTVEEPHSNRSQSAKTSPSSEKGNISPTQTDLTMQSYKGASSDEHAIKESKPQEIIDEEPRNIGQHSPSAIFPSAITVEQHVKPIDSYPFSYGRLAAFMDSDPQILMSRKFGWLHARAILDLQDQLSRLEDQLVELDENEFPSENYDQWFHEDYWASGGSAKRQEILQNMHSKLDAYDRLVFNTNKMQSFKRPNVRHQDTLKKLIDNIEDTVVAGSQWIHNGRDLAALHNEGQQGGFSVWLEILMAKMSRTATAAIFRTREQHLQTTGLESELSLHSHFRLGILIRSVVTSFGAALFFIPVYLLPTVVEKSDGNNLNQVVLTSAFTLTFSAFCSIFTGAGANEVYIATAAYAAVLVIYVGCLS